MFLTVERAMDPAPPGTLALPMLLERKGYGLETKSATVAALASNPGRLLEYRALLARRSALALRPAGTSGDEEQRLGFAREVDTQIETLELEAGKTIRASVDADPRASEYAKALGDELNKRIYQYLKHHSKDDRTHLQEQMLQIQHEVEAELATRFKDYFDARERRARGTREELLPRIQATLGSAVLLEMVRFRPFRISSASERTRWEPARYVAYVVRAAGPPALVDLGEASAIDDLIVEFRRALSTPHGTLAHELGRRLDAVLMQPLRPHLLDSKEIAVAPDGLLNLVPFGALVDDRDHYLVETFTFDYLSSGRDLLRAAPAASARPGAPVVIADPLFDVESPDHPIQQSVLGTRFEPLPGSAVEAEAVSHLVAGAAVFTRERATETALKSVNAPRILHIATHGFFLEDQDPHTAPGAAATAADPMLRSGLVFAGANAGRSGSDDGVLTALEAAALGLSGTQLVVLSACETGVGEVKTGEGVFGLRRAFMAAGAETLVMSLWRVDDDATRQLMEEFYHHLTKGEGRTEALRHAALALLRDPAHQHPFYWASFIATGNGGPLRP